MYAIRHYFNMCAGAFRKNGRARGKRPGPQLWQQWGRAVWANAELQEAWFSRPYVAGVVTDLPAEVVRAIHAEALKDGYMEPPRAEDEYV
jgi:hypothetical protein